MASSNCCIPCLRALRHQAFYTPTRQDRSTQEYPYPQSGPSPVPAHFPFVPLPPPLKPFPNPYHVNTLPRQPNHPSSPQANPNPSPLPSSSPLRSTNGPPRSQKPTSPTASARSSSRNVPARPTTLSRSGTRRTA
ncbi:MAG: hypothetical protein Q9177_001119 [Variospora cf. flavescens]